MPPKLVRSSEPQSWKLPLLPQIGMGWQSPVAPQVPCQALSLLFQEGDMMNQAFQPLVETLSQIPKPGESLPLACTSPTAPKCNSALVSPLSCCRTPSMVPWHGQGNVQTA